MRSSRRQWSSVVAVMLVVTLMAAAMAPSATASAKPQRPDRDCYQRKVPRRVKRDGHWVIVWRKEVRCRRTHHHPPPPTTTTTVAPTTTTTSTTVAPTTTTTVAPTTTTTIAGGGGAPTEAQVDTMVDDAVDAADLTNAVAASTDVLTTAGIGILPSGGGTGADTPPGGLNVDPSQLPAIALDAQARSMGGRVSLMTFAEDLYSGGAITPATQTANGVDDFALGAAAQQLLANWLAAARANPSDPDAAPIFALARLAARQDPAIDISAPSSYQAQDLNLGLLDLNVLSAGIAQVAPWWRGGQPPPAAPSSARSALTRLAATSTPCSDLVQALDNWVPMAGQAFGYGAGTAAGSVIQALATQLSQFLGAGAGTAAAQAAAFGSLLSLVGLLGQLSALYELYTHTTASLQSDNGDGPFAQQAPTDPTKVLPFTVTAGVNDADWAQYQSSYSPVSQAVKDCASQLGLPTISDVSSIAGAIAKWQARWRLEQNDRLGQISLADNPLNEFFLPGDLSKLLIPSSDHAGTSKLNVDLLDDPFANQPGTVVIQPMTVMAMVVTAPPPDLSVLTGAIAAGIAGPLAGAASIISLLAGWLQTEFTFDATKAVTVSYHQPTPGVWRGKVVATFFGANDQSQISPSFSMHEHREEYSADNARVTGEFSEGLVPGTTAFWAENFRDASTARWSFHQDSFQHSTVNIPPGGYTDFTDTGYGQSSGNVAYNNMAGGISISVAHDGSWQVVVDGGSPSLPYPASSRGYHDELKIVSNYQHNSDSINNDPAGAPGSFGANVGTLFTGHFDPTQPPTTLTSTIITPAQQDGVDGTLTSEMTLDFGKPITVP